MSLPVARLVAPAWRRFASLARAISRAVRPTDIGLVAGYVAVGCTLLVVVLLGYVMVTSGSTQQRTRDEVKILRAQVEALTRACQSKEAP